MQFIPKSLLLSLVVYNASPTDISIGNKSAPRGILCYVHLVQRALFACLTFQASLLKMSRLYEVKTIVRHNILDHAHLLASSTIVVNVKRDRCAKVYSEEKV